VICLINYDYGDLISLTIYGVGDIVESVVMGKWEGYVMDYYNNGELDYERNE
jgi:hypothetical protein